MTKISPSSTPALALRPLTGPLPGSFTFGEHAAWILHDGFYLAELPSLVPPAAVDEALRVVSGEFIEGERLRLSVNVPLLRWGKELILVDTGCASWYGPSLGQLPRELAAVGFGPEEITSVVFTHLHLDHLAGAADLARKVPRFPNARYYVAREELAFWSQSSPDLSGARAPAEALTKIVQGVHEHLAILEPSLTVFDSSDVLFEGFQATPLPGHTPGHVGFDLRSGRDRLWFVADALTHSTLHLARPEWTSSGDALPTLNVQTRRALLETAAREDALLLATHFTYPGMGYVKQVANGGYRFEPRA